VGLCERSVSRHEDTLPSGYIFLPSLALPRITVRSALRFRRRPGLEGAP
jgi:hypothetical protein